jgi:pyridoxamine 5'-phosphate oxidase
MNKLFQIQRLLLYKFPKILNFEIKTMSIDIGGMRKPYLAENQIFDIETLVGHDPYDQFKNWFEVAKKTTGIEEANAMCLATASKAGLPSARYVLLKVII